MASISISASLQRACSSNHVSMKQQPLGRVARSLGTKQATKVVTLNIEGQTSSSVAEKLAVQEKPHVENEAKNGGFEPEFIGSRFTDERWKNGTWDLNVFVKDEKIDWDGLILAETKRRKFLELYPEASTNGDPVLFKSSIIPWWAWLKRSYLPQAELLNGRAAMIGFFTAYVVDGLTGLGMVGQTGNFVCKAGVFLTVIGVIFFRRSQDFDSLKKLVDEASLYDKQWQSSWLEQENKF